MQYKGTTLVLDNFRSVLKDFTVDVQDVVRSALLDNVSIERYLDSCKNNPYRLDQIRLGKKEGIDERFFQYTSGEVIRGIRGLLKQGVNLSQLKKYKAGSLSDKCFLYLIYWCKDGFNVSNLNLSIIPDYLLEFFDYGVRKGFDMKPFNNGVQYTLVFVDTCIKIMENGCRIDKYSKGDWSPEVISKMESMASLAQKGVYNTLYESINSEDSLERVCLYEEVLMRGADLSVLSKRLEDGSYKYDNDVLSVISSGLKQGINLVGQADKLSLTELQDLLSQERLKNERVLSGRLRRK